MLLEQKRILYYERKKIVNQDNKFTLPLLYLGVLSSIFILFFGDKFPRKLFKLGKNIVKIGVKRTI